MLPSAGASKRTSSLKIPPQSPAAADPLMAVTKAPSKHCLHGVPKIEVPPSLPCIPQTMNPIQATRSSAVSLSQLVVSSAPGADGYSNAATATATTAPTAALECMVCSAARRRWEMEPRNTDRASVAVLINNAVGLHDDASSW